MFRVCVEDRVRDRIHVWDRVRVRVKVLFYFLDLGFRIFGLKSMV